MALLKEFNFPIKDAPKNISTDEAEVGEVIEKVDAEPEVEAVKKCLRQLVKRKVQKLIRDS